MPNYFAGTLNSASGSVYVEPPVGTPASLVKVELFLGTVTGGFTRVAAWEQIPGEPETVAKGVGCTFDSSHFADGTQLHVVVSGEDSLGNHYQDLEVVPVKNKALLGNHMFTSNPLQLPDHRTQSHPVVKAKLEQAQASYGIGRYTVWKRADGNLDLAQWRPAIERANFIYVTSHGTSDIYEMENGDPFFDSNGPSDPDSHKTILEGCVGSVFGADSYPPYNPSGTPPCNFMFLDTCYTMAADFGWVLYPKLNLYDGSGLPKLRNQYVAGWTVKTNILDSRFFATLLMDRLKDGWTAKKAVEWMADEAGARCKTVFNQPGNFLSAADVAGQGDDYTKLCGAYTGTYCTEVVSLDTRWYR